MKSGGVVRPCAVSVCATVAARLRRGRSGRPGYGSGVVGRERPVVQRPRDVSSWLAGCRVCSQTTWWGDWAGRGTGLEQVGSGGDPLRHPLAGDLVEVVAERSSSSSAGSAARPLNRRTCPPRSARSCRRTPTAPPASGTTSSARRSICCSVSSVWWIELGSGPSYGAPRVAAGVVVVLVLQPAERVTELVRRDQRGQRVAARRGRVRAAGAAVRVAVADSKDLPVATRSCRAPGRRTGPRRSS